MSREDACRFVLFLFLQGLVLLFYILQLFYHSVANYDFMLPFFIIYLLYCILIDFSCEPPTGNRWRGLLEMQIRVG